jgi:hypothetical protein
MKSGMMKIGSSLMIFLLLPSGNFALWKRGKRNSGTQDIRRNERQSIMRSALSAVIVLSILLAIAVLMSGCTSKGGSVTSIHFGFPVIGAEIDFVLSVPAVEVLSSPPTSQPSSEVASAE